MRATSTATLPFPITTARSPREVELEVLVVGVAVVPGDELGRGPRAGQVLARDAEPPVGLRADRVDDGVVEPRELVVRDVAADLDVAEEAEARRRAVFSKTRETALISGGRARRRGGRGPTASAGARSGRPRPRVGRQQLRRPRRSPAGPEPTTATRSATSCGHARQSVRAVVAAAVRACPPGALAVLGDLEAVAAAARAGGVRVVDLEPGLLERLDEVDGRALQVRERWPDRRPPGRRGTRARCPRRSRRGRSRARTRTRRSPPPWIATRKTSASPAGSSAISAFTLSAAARGQGDHRSLGCLDRRHDASVPTSPARRIGMPVVASETGNWEGETLVRRLAAVRDLRVLRPRDSRDDDRRELPVRNPAEGTRAGADDPVRVRRLRRARRPSSASPSAST